MVDMTAIGGIAASLNAATQIAKKLVGVRDFNLLGEAVLKLQGEIMSAQAAALTAQSDQFTLLQQIRELERRVADFEAWETEKKRYELVELFGRSLAYVVKESMRGAEPLHYLCPTCYQKRQKSLMQGITAIGMRSLKCHACELIIEHSEDPNYRPFV